MAMIAQGDIQDNDYITAFHEGKKAGIMKVVDWIMSDQDSVYVNRPRWQAKLKDWGIKEAN